MSSSPPSSSKGRWPNLGSPCSIYSCKPHNNAENATRIIFILPKTESRRGRVPGLRLQSFSMVEQESHPAAWIQRPCSPTVYCTAHLNLSQTQLKHHHLREASPVYPTSLAGTMSSTLSTSSFLNDLVLVFVSFLPH